MGQYIALQSVQVVDDNGVRQAIEPKSEKYSGLFEHDFDSKTEKRLLDLGAIRHPEGTEQHEDPTEVEALHDSTVIPGTATTVVVNNANAGEDAEPTDELAGLKVADLKALAATEEVDLGEVTKKDDIVAAIRAARAKKATDAEDLLGDD